MEFSINTMKNDIHIIKQVLQTSRVEQISNLMT